MYTWYVKILLDCGEYVYITIGNESINDSGKIIEKYFCGDPLKLIGLGDKDNSHKMQVWVKLGSIQTLWVSPSPFSDETSVS